MKGTRKYLLVSGVFIIVVGLFYGSPKSFLEGSFGITVDENSLHIFRAIMGLYCGVGFMVLLGAKHREYTKFSLLLQVVFFSGIGFGRIISFIIDGTISKVSLMATVSELILFIICVVVLKNYLKLSKIHNPS